MSIIVKIMGGLGNQMFQYACGKAISQRLNTRLYLDLSWYKEGNRVFLLSNFPNIRYKEYKNIKKHQIFRRLLRKINKKISSNNEIQKIEETVEQSCTNWQKIEEIQSSAHLTGYWQNEKYFSNIDSIIKQDFNFPKLTSSIAIDISEKIIKSPCSVSIHVRRGDYISNSIANKTHGICSFEYYNKAIKLIANKNDNRLNLFIFSDDLEWVKENFDTQGYATVIVNILQHRDTPYHDMHLMSLCKHHIIANSSFSWWGAWLSNKNGIIIAPKQWFADDKMKHFNPSCESWIKI